MKLTKIFAGMAAAAIATTAMAVTAFAADSTAYNYLFIATDIPCEYNDNDEALVNGQVVTCKDLKVKIGSQEFNVSAAPGKSDSDKLCFQIINKWNSKFTSEITDYTVAGAGEYITIDFTIEGLGDTTGNAGVSFQADGTWDFRNPDDKEKDKVAQPAYFPNKCVGIAGGAGGFDTNVDCQDTAINGDGSYTISIAQSGTVNAEAQKFDDGSTNEGWIWAANAVPVAPATSGTDSNSKRMIPRQILSLTARLIQRLTAQPQQLLQRLVQQAQQLLHLQMQLLTNSSYRRNSRYRSCRYCSRRCSYRSF